MSKNKPLIPFSYTPASWGLKGKSRQRAEAEYLYTGEELERKLIEIEFEGKERERRLAALDLKYHRIDAFAYDNRLLAIDGKDGDAVELLALGLKHGKKTPYEYDTAIARLKNRGNDLELALLEVDLKHSKKNQYEYDTAVALLKNRGRDLEIALLEIERNHGKIEEPDYVLRMVDILHPEEGPTKDRALLDAKHSIGKLSDYDYEVKIAEFEYPAESSERDLAILEAKHRHGKIEQNAYEKEKATLNEEPWIAVIDSGFDPEKGLNGVYFEFDWNELWITYLRMNGYSGPTEAAVVDAWFADVCRAQGLAAMNANPFEVVPFGLG
jgi:hypothetical protein